LAGYDFVLLMLLCFVARVICKIQPPHVLIHANRAWTELTGYQQHEMQGNTLHRLQGKLTNLDHIHQMMDNVRRTGFGTSRVINYTKAGDSFMVQIRIQPILAINNFGDPFYSHLFASISPAPIDETAPLPSFVKNAQQLEGYQWMIANTLYQESDCSGDGDSSSLRSKTSSDIEGESSVSKTSPIN
jgi:PAS domain S-box-containing protein